jgi:hypothetical protein
LSVTFGTGTEFLGVSGRYYSLQEKSLLVMAIYDGYLIVSNLQRYSEEKNSDKGLTIHRNAIANLRPQ